jgi:hypothetical protein
MKERILKKKYSTLNKDYGVIKNFKIKSKTAFKLCGFFCYVPKII